MSAADLSEFDSPKSPHAGRCGMIRIFEGLSDGERDKLKLALGSPHIQHRMIVAWVRARELQVSDSMVARHRRGLCSCDR